jgi:hypothetical protein
VLHAAPGRQARRGVHVGGARHAHGHHLEPLAAGRRDRAQHQAGVLPSGELEGRIRVLVQVALEERTEHGGGPVRRLVQRELLGFRGPYHPPDHRPVHEVHVLSGTDLGDVLEEGALAELPAEEALEQQRLPVQTSVTQGGQCPGRGGQRLPARAAPIEQLPEAHRVGRQHETVAGCPEHGERRQHRPRRFWGIR